MKFSDLMGKSERIDMGRLLKQQSQAQGKLDRIRDILELPRYRAGPFTTIELIEEIIYED